MKWWQIKKKDTNQQNQEKSNRKKKNSAKVQHIKYALPFSFDTTRELFKDTDGNYIKMIQTNGSNLFGFKEEDQEAYCDGLSNMFSNTIDRGQIYSYELPADIDGYVRDFEKVKKTISTIEDPAGAIKYDNLDRAQNRLIETSETRELVDRCFLIILKDKDIFNLDNRCYEIVSVLNRYQKTRVLSSKEMVQVIYNYYNPKNSMFIEKMYKDIDKTNIMDFLYPDYIGSVNSGFKQAIMLNGIYCKTKYVSTWKKEPVFALLSYIATFPDIDFSLHFEIDHKDTITDDIDKDINSLNKNLDQPNLSDSEVAKIQRQIDDNRELVDQLMESSTGLFYSVSLRIKADSMEELDELEKEVDRFCKGYGMLLRSGIFQPLELFNLSAPICHNSVDYYMNKTTADTIGYMYPFIFESLYDSTEQLDPITKEKLFNVPPIYIGNTLQTGGVVFYDNFTKKGDRTNYNEFIVGLSGMGKTTFIMYLILMRQALGYKQYIIDVEGKELHKLTYSLGGENINCANGDRGRINPFHMRFNIPDSETNEDKVPLEEIKPLKEQIWFLRNIFNAYKGNSDQIGLLENNFIEKAIETIYENKGITFETTAKEIMDNYTNEDYPIMMDLYNELVNQFQLARTDPLVLPKKLERIETCMAFIEPMARGADASIFNGPTNINLDNDLLCFNLSGLQINTENPVLKTQYFNVLSFIWTNIISNPNRVRQQIYADEFSVIMDPRYMDVMMFFQTIAKRIRKYWGGLTTATQQISDVLKPSVKEQGEAIISQSTYKFYFGIGTEDIVYFDNTNLIPESEKLFIQIANMGECYFKCGQQTAMRVKISFGQDDLEYFESMKS